MQSLKHILKYRGPLMWMPAVCVFLLTLLLNERMLPQSDPTTFRGTINEATFDTASHYPASTAQRAFRHSRNNCHLSVRHKTAAKLLMKKGSSEDLHIMQLQLAATIVGNTVNHRSIVVLPGYYLFLFRYALF